MFLTIAMLFLTLAVAGLLFSALIPVPVTARLAAAANTFQLHTIAILGIYPSFALMAWLALWPAALGNQLWRWPWMRALALLALIQAISIAWAPNPVMGVRHLIYFAPLPLAALAFYKLARNSPDAAYRCMQMLLAPTCALALLVMLFRLFPALEGYFLSHPIAGLFISPNTLEGLYGSGRNNVLDPSKSGGLFVNANIASTYLGMSAMAAWYLAKAWKSTLFRAIAVFNWTAVLFTGSKAGLLLAFVIPAGLAVFGIVSTRRTNPVRLLFAILAVGATAALLTTPSSQTLIESYQYETLATLGTRDELWDRATQMILQRPLTGLGFGGWENLFAVQTFLTGQRAMPAHNSLAILWLQSGLLAVLAGVAVITAVLQAAARAVSASHCDIRPLATGLIGAFSWYVIQGMGENFGLVGEAHMSPLLGALLGLTCGRFDSETQSAEKPIDERQTINSHSAPPALSTV